MHNATKADLHYLSFFEGGKGWVGKNTPHGKILWIWKGFGDAQQPWLAWAWFYEETWSQSFQEMWGKATLVGLGMVIQGHPIMKTAFGNPNVYFST